jgi:TP901 family phage tail tape measure protein
VRTHKVSIQFVTQLQSLKAAERELMRIEKIMDQIEADPVNLLGHSPQQVALMKKQLIDLRASIGAFKLGAVDAFDKYAVGARQANINQARLTREIRETTTAIAQQRKQVQLLMMQEDRRLSVANRTRRALGQSFLEAPLYSVSFASMALIAESVRQYVELDKTLTRIGIVAERSAESMKIFGEYANNAGKELGVTGRRFAEASLIFLQQGGLAADYASSLGEASIKLANITGTKAEDTSEYITSIANSFKLLESDGLRAGDRIIDMLAALDFSSGSSADEIAEAFTRSASSFAAAGFSAEQAAAMISVVSETTRQSARMVGTGFKTLIGNLAEVRKGSKEFDEISSKLQDVARNFGFAFNIIDENTGDMKEVPKILQEVADLYNKTSSTAAKYALVEAVAGKEQRDRFIALITNQERYNELLEIAENSTGAAAAGQAKYMESAAAKIEQIKNEWEELVINIMDDKMFKSFLDQLSAVLGNFNSAMETGNKFLVLIGTISKLLGPLLASKIFTSQGFTMMAMGLNSRIAGEAPIQGARFVSRLPEAMRNTYMQEAQQRKIAILEEQRLQATRTQTINQYIQLRGELKRGEISVETYRSKLQGLNTTLLSTRNAIVPVQKEIASLTTSMTTAAATATQLAKKQGMAMTGFVALGAAAQSAGIATQEGLTGMEKGLGYLSAALPVVGTVIGTFFGGPVVGMMLGSLAGMLLGFIKVDKAAQKARDAIATASATARESFESNADRIKFLESEIKRLEKFGLTQEDANNLKNYRNEIAKLMPELQTGVDKYGNAILMGNVAMSARIRLMEEEIKRQEEINRLKMKESAAETLEAFETGSGKVQYERRTSSGKVENLNLSSKNISEKIEHLEKLKRAAEKGAPIIVENISALEDAINQYYENLTDSVLEDRGTFVRAIGSQIDDKESAEIITNALAIVSPEKMKEFVQTWSEEGAPALISLSNEIVKSFEDFSNAVIPKSLSELVNLGLDEKRLAELSAELGLSIDAIKDIIAEKIKELNDSFYDLSAEGKKESLDSLIADIFETAGDQFEDSTTAFIKKLQDSKGNVNEVYKELMIFYQELAQFMAAYGAATADGFIDEKEKATIDSMRGQFQYLKIPEATKVYSKKPPGPRDRSQPALSFEFDISSIPDQSKILDTTEKAQMLRRTLSETLSAIKDLSYFTMEERIGFEQLSTEIANAKADLERMTEGTTEYIEQLELVEKLDFNKSLQELSFLERKIADLQELIKTTDPDSDDFFKITAQITQLAEERLKAIGSINKEFEDLASLSEDSINRIYNQYREQLEGMGFKESDFFDQLAQHIKDGTLTIAQAAAGLGSVLSEAATLNDLAAGIARGEITQEQYNKIASTQFKFIKPQIFTSFGDYGTEKTFMLQGFEINAQEIAKRSSSFTTKDGGKTKEASISEMFQERQKQVIGFDVYELEYQIARLELVKDQAGVLEEIIEKKQQLLSIQLQDNRELIQYVQSQMKLAKSEEARSEWAQKLTQLYREQESLLDSQLKIQEEIFKGQEERVVGSKFLPLQRDLAKMELEKAPAEEIVKQREKILDLQLKDNRALLEFSQTQFDNAETEEVREYWTVKITELYKEQTSLLDSQLAIQKEIIDNESKIFNDRLQSLKDIDALLRAQLSNAVEKSEEYFLIQDKIIANEKEIFALNRDRLDYISMKLKDSTLLEEVRSGLLREQHSLLVEQENLQSRINDLVKQRAIDAFNLALYGSADIEALKEQYSITLRLIDDIIDAHEQIIQKAQLELDIQKEIESSTNETYKSNLRYIQNKLKDVKLTKQIVDSTRAQLELLKALSGSSTGQMRLTRTAEGRFRFVSATETGAEDRASQLEAASKFEQDAISKYRSMTDEIFSIEQQIAQMKSKGQDTKNLEALRDSLKEQRLAQAEEVLKAKTISALIASGQSGLASQLTAGKITVEEAMSGLTPEQQAAIKTSAETELSGVLSSQSILIGSNYELIASQDKLADAFNKFKIEMKKAVVTTPTPTPAPAQEQSSGTASTTASAPTASVPAPGPAPAPVLNQHTVQVGDTLSKIAAQRKTTLSHLKSISENKWIGDRRNPTGNPPHGWDYIRPGEIVRYDTGGYTGNFDGGKLAMLHEKELVLNKMDTENILKAVSMLRPSADMSGLNRQITPLSRTGTDGGQNVVINASFPGVSSSEEIQRAFKSMSTRALQYAYRTKSY